MSAEPFFTWSLVEGEKPGDPLELWETPPPSTKGVSCYRWKGGRWHHRAGYTGPWEALAPGILVPGTPAQHRALQRGDDART